jgi:hypothetical protein
MDYNIGTVTSCIYIIVVNGLMDNEKPCYTENIEEYYKYYSTYTRQIC